MKTGKDSKGLLAHVQPTPRSAQVRGHAREDDLAVNVCREKKMTNIRSSTSDIAVRLTPPIKMTLEKALAYIQDDELVEVTPLNIRLRKRALKPHERKRAKQTADA